MSRLFFALLVSVATVIGCQVGTSTTQHQIMSCYSNSGGISCVKTATWHDTSPRALSGDTRMHAFVCADVDSDDDGTPDFDDDHDGGDDHHGGDCHCPCDGGGMGSGSGSGSGSGGVGVAAGGTSMGDGDDDDHDDDDSCSCPGGGSGSDDGDDGDGDDDDADGIPNSVDCGHQH